MPLELRKIQFTLDEIHVATIEYLRDNGRPMPQTLVTDVVIRNDPNATVVLHFAAGTRMPEPGEVALTCDEVVEALIRFCLRLRIPLPRSGKKVLWHLDDTLALMITLTVDTDAMGRERRAVR